MVPGTALLPLNKSRRHRAISALLISTMSGLQHTHGHCGISSRSVAPRTVFVPARVLRPSGISRRPPCRITASAAAASFDFSKHGGYVTYNARDTRPEPPKLPPPPKSGEDLTHVLPYILKLALAEKQLSWRVGAAVVLMLASKAAGKVPRDAYYAPMRMHAATPSLNH